MKKHSLNVPIIVGFLTAILLATLDPRVTDANHTLPPNAPYDLNVTGVTESSISIAWKNPGGPTFDGYNIYRWNGSTFQHLATINRGQYTDINLACATTYSYQVSAYNRNGEGDRSRSIDGRTSDCNSSPPPQVPTPTPAPGPAQIGADVRISNFTILDDEQHGSLTSYNIQDDPIVLRPVTVWVEIANRGGQNFAPSNGADGYKLQVVIKNSGGLDFVQTYTSGKTVFVPLQSIAPGGSTSIPLQLFFFQPIDNGSIEVFLLPDSQTGISASTLPGRSLRVKQNPDSYRACLATAGQQILKAAHLYCLTTGPGAETCSAALNRADLGLTVLKCGDDAECLARDTSTWLVGSVPIAGEVLGPLAGWLNGLNEPPACLKPVEQVTAILNTLLHNHLERNGVFTQSPVYPLVVNGAGQRAGFLPNGQRITEIPGSVVAQVGEKRFVLYPGSEPVQVQVVGYGPGTMTLSGVFSTGGGSGTNVSYINVPVSTGMKATLNSSDTSHALQIDANGDNRPERSLAPDTNLSIGTGSSPPSSINPPSSNSYSFPQTGFAVAGRFWDVWGSGRSFEDSLYINGFPITALRPEVSTTDGKTYQTQWFERARFEQHPENQPPYDVLLGLLGVSAAQGRQNEEPFKPVPNPGGGITWFQDTSHTLGDSSEGGRAIAAYWNRLGGLSQFGFPLSQPFLETNRGDGKAYLVQYFQRQRFEYHPENKGTQYEVLLGRLGAEQVEGEKSASPPPPPPTTRPISTPVPVPPGAISAANVKRLVLLRTMKHLAGVTSVAFSPDGQIVASGAGLWSGEKGFGDTVRLWKVADGSPLRTLKGHSGGIEDITFSPDGRTLASGSSWDKTARLWEVSDGRLLRTIQHAGGVYSVAFSPDGQAIAVAGNGSGQANSISLSRVSDGTFLRSIGASETGTIFGVAFSPDGQTLAAVRGGVHLWRVSDGTLLKSLEGRTREKHTVYKTCLAFSPNGEYVASGDFMGTDSNGDRELEPVSGGVQVSRVSDGALLQVLETHTDTVTSVAFSPYGHMLASTSVDNTVRLWQVDTGALLHTLPGHNALPGCRSCLGIHSVAFSPNGQLLVVGHYDGSVELWGVR